MRYFPKNVYLYKAKQHLLKYRLSSPHPVKSTIINNNWAYRQNTVPIRGFTPHRIPCWGQSGSQIGGSGNSFLHYGHGHGTGLINQRHLINRRPTCLQMADQLLLPAWEVSVGSGLQTRQITALPLHTATTGVFSRSQDTHHSTVVKHFPVSKTDSEENFHKY